MKHLREDLKILLSSNDSSLYYWIKVLNFFDQHRNELNITEIVMLAEMSEVCRIFHNTDREEIITIHKNGKDQKQTIIKHGVGIAEADVNPNIMTYLAHRIEKENTSEQNIDYSNFLEDIGLVPLNDLRTVPAI